MTLSEKDISLMRKAGKIIYTSSKDFRDHMKVLLILTVGAGEAALERKDRGSAADIYRAVEIMASELGYDMKKYRA